MHSGYVDALVSASTVIANAAPAVSVLLPVFNERPAFLAQAVESILEQTFPDFELLILNDGSDDTRTREALAGYRHVDPRVSVYDRCHRGITETLNAGLALCRGEFVCRQDSDDWSNTGRLQTQLAYLRARRDVGIVGSAVVLHREDGALLWKLVFPFDTTEIMRAFPERSPFCGGAVMFRREQALEVGGYRAGLACGQDYDFFWRICERFGGANLPEALYHYRRTARSITVQRYREQARGAIMARTLARSRADGLGEDETRASRAAEEVIESRVRADFLPLASADHLMLAGYYRRALAVYCQCLVKQPTRPLPYVKLARLAGFVLVPPLRKHLFRRF
jgi:glycosyltransferase involved in cell wall biosynthesis